MKNLLATKYSINDFAATVLEVEKDLKEQYDNLLEYYMDVPFDVIRVTIPHILGAFHKKGISSYFFTLTYDKSLHVRGDMQTGAIHFSTLFSMFEDEEDDDDEDVVYSEFDINGKLIGGRCGRFIELVASI